MTNITPVITSPHNSAPAVALRLGRPLPGFLAVEFEFVATIAPAWALAAIEGAE